MAQNATDMVGKKKGKKQKVEPPHTVAWFHPAKTALAFGVTVMTYANNSLPEKEGGGLLGAWSPFFLKYNQDTWFRDGVWQPDCDHAAVNKDAFTQYRDEWVGIFRQPEQRVIAAWQDKGAGKGTVLAYARRAEGSMTKQLAGQEQGEKWLYWPGKAHCGGKGAADTDEKPQPDVRLALQRLKRFKFVGLAEEYDFSVCLFHATFGGDCRPTEFKRMKPGGYGVKQNVAQLKGYTDPYDAQVYEAVRARFWQDMTKYGLTRSKCKEICPNAAPIFDVFGLSLARARRVPEALEFNWPGRYGLDEMW
eukprot:CAMPEP_0197942184 /NCGR_PEP_ID=MMETSP1439-20131203/123953_1 /TAXON_ID=66791 /ORGANISM="Gonyaulax spinifera, Strain CCMP409" /LENGTH=305 /DNA_ID=CAMNT_0043565425 /DNA_START=8 /DNA_END=922 /DNA_ORIENTATION=-